MLRGRAGRDLSALSSSVGAVTIDAAQACVDHFIESKDAAYRYAFPSQAALEFATIDEEQGGMQNLCRSATAGIARAGSSSQASGTPAATVCSDVYIELVF